VSVNELKYKVFFFFSCSRKGAYVVRKAKQPKAKSYLAYDIAGVALLFAGPIALVSLAWRDSSGALGRALNDLLKGLVGQGAYALPLLLIGLGVLFLAGPVKTIRRNCSIGAVILYFVVISGLQLGIKQPSSIIAAYHTGAGGGVLGAIIAVALRRIIGHACSYIALAAIGVIAVLLITDVPLAHM
jgi:S-DNA-T family DNA segregation ATPase FtsK/SpoIIIE